ncbi:hypothetical protein PVAP13_2KG375661 [Panicum virgatum]|uniref:Uncharacterized protein n=1 Tax=Panicum virgatum TaxID=38727 RepID=A0A8T0WFN0_PANVG|nr:hypothetical protein PVAP13_2KG375661 [Panicum virgatum]
MTIQHTFFALLGLFYCPFSHINLHKILFGCHLIEKNNLSGTISNLKLSLIILS